MGDVVTFPRSSQEAARTEPNQFLVQLGDKARVVSQELLGFVERLEQVKDLFIETRKAMELACSDPDAAAEWFETNRHRFPPSENSGDSAQFSSGVETQDRADQYLEMVPEQTPGVK